MLQGATNNGLVGFFTDQKGGGSSFTITGREMIDYLVQGGDAGIYGPTASKYGLNQTPQSIMLHNIKQNWPQMVMAGVLIPAAFTVGKRVLGKSILRPTRKMIKMTGLDVTV